MSISSNILTQAGLTKIQVTSSDANPHKIRLYSFSHQIKGDISKIQAALQDLLHQGRSYEGNLSQLHEDIQSKPYLLREGNVLKLISAKHVDELQKNSYDLAFLEATLLQETRENKKGFTHQGFLNEASSLQISSSVNPHFDSIEAHQQTKFYLIFLKGLLERKNPLMEGWVYMKLGDLYHSLGEHYQALEYHKKFLKIALLLKNLRMKGNAYSYLGITYSALGDHHLALKLHDKHLSCALELKDPQGEGKAYANLGITYRSLGDHHQALKLHEKHLNSAIELKDKLGEAGAYSNLGMAYASLGHHHRAVELYEKHLAIALELQNRSEEGSAYCQLGNAYQSLGNYAKALTFHHHHLAIARELHDRSGEGIAYANLGIDYASLGDYSKAITFHEKDVLIALHLKDLVGEGRAYCNLGNAYRSLGNYLKAIEFHEKELNITLKLQNKVEEGMVYGNLGTDYYALGNHAKALEFHHQHLRIALELKDKVGEKAAYANLGNAHHFLGEAHQALEWHHKNLQLALELKDRVGERGAYTNLGNAYTFLGKYHAAVEVHEKALEIALELKDRVGEGTVYTNLGLDYYSLKEYLKAIEFHKKHLLIALELSDRIGECNAYGNLGAAYLSLKDYPQALRFQEKSLKIALELKDYAREGSIHLSLGSIYNSLGNIHQAASCYHRALTIALNLNNAVAVGKAYINLGTIYDSLGTYEKAIEFYEKALAIALQLKDVLGEWRAYCNLGRMDYLLKNYPQAEEYFRKGIHITSPLQQDVKRAQWQVTLFEEWSNLYFFLEETLLRQNKTLDALEITDMRRARALSSLIRDKFSSQKIKAPSLEQVPFTTMQKLSKKFNTAFITYSFIYPQEGPYIKVWIISPHQNSREPISLSLSFDSNTFKDIPALLKTFPYGLRPRVKRGEKATDVFKKHLSHWYELLITPLEPYLSQVKENQSLTFIPDKFLAHLPFGAFYHVATDQYLIEKYPISLAPSIQVLHLLDELSPSLSQGILLMGNPLTPHTQDNHLKFTEVEVREILAPLMNVPLTQVLTRENATTENFLKQAPQARIIHIACHGMIDENAQDHPDSNFDPHSVFKGLFKLTPDEAHPSGIFRSEEIASMSLKADLVFMSACHLGRGNLKREGSIGPIWSFLGSGAKSTIASYWPLPDSAVTVQMVEVFYRYLLGIGAPKLNKAEALQKAILLGMQKNRDNIEQWGSFFLSGLIA